MNQLTGNQVRRLNAANMSSHVLVWMLSLFCVLSVMAGCGDSEDASGEDLNPEQQFVPPTEEGSWILVDNIHTLFNNPDKKAFRGNYAYDGMHGYHRVFRHLEANGYPYSQLFQTSRGERLTPEVLKGFKVLFINLVTKERPDFTLAEIEAIHEFVQAGGGLYVVADHTNVYRHAERINPILIPMGIEVHYSTAAETSAEHAVGGFWLKIRNFDRTHPITEGVSMASWQTGSVLVTDHGFAFTSENAFADFWEGYEDDVDPGYYGDFVFNEGELAGELPVMAATTFGEGRVVVVGDENIFGDEWLFIGNNFELVSNIFEWVAGNENDPVPLRERLESRYTVVGFDLLHSQWNIAVGSCSNYFPFYINFNRTENVAGRGIETYDNTEDALVFTNPATEFTENELTQIRGYLQSQKTVVVLGDVTRTRSGTEQLLKTFVPDVTFSGLSSFGLDELPATSADVETVISEEAFEISSEFLEVAGMRMSGHTYPVGVSCPLEIEESQHYMRKLTATGGEPFMQATVEGELVDLARIYDVDGGRLIVFFQDGFWRNETLGWELQRPSPSTADAHEIEYAFIDWLVAQSPGGQ